tara:strand:- start:79 stop:504 length:426 start_codon:yes stop_codon:yes gene_type:complete
MIKYRLKCKDCEIISDSWFSSFKDFDKIKKLKLLTCNSCGSNQIEKSLMSPNLSNNKKKFSSNENLKIKEIKNKLKIYQKFVKDNFRYVGKNFSYEARSLIYDTKNNEKGIYGKATKEEIEELNDEGIKADIIPWVNEKEN